MKSRTVPFLPAKDFSERSVPLTSGRVNSSTVEPIAGGAGTSFANATPATTNSRPSRIDRFLFFIYYVSFERSRLHRFPFGVICGSGVACAAADGCRRAFHRSRRNHRFSRFWLLRAQRSHPASQP